MSSADQIEREFAELPTQIQLALLERLVHCIRAKGATVDEHFSTDVAAMAADPQIIREIRQIDAEFHDTENDGLRAL
jgi:hypothetical protein